MPIRLIYHTLEEQAGTISPFDEAITEMVEGQHTLIACPYLGMDYLRRITSLSASWRVITDIEEWLRLHEVPERSAIQQFVEQHHQDIHHVKDLHAKVIVAGTRALVGSANFTQKGITGRTEMSVLFEDEPQVEELRQWFEALWLQSAVVEIADLHTCIGALPRQSSVSLGDKTRLPSRPAPIRSKLKPLTTQMLPNCAAQDIDAHLLLIDCVKKAPGRTWMHGYFDLMKRVIDATELRSDDPRLVTSIRKSGGRLFPMSINNRWVLSPCKEDGKWYIRIIYGPEFAFLSELQARVAHYLRFDPLPGESVNTPFLPYFKDIDALLSGEWDEGWLRAAKAEITRATASPYRRYHQPVVYEAAVNLNYRALVLDAAFGAC